MTQRARYRTHDGRRYRIVMNEGFEGFVVHWTSTCAGCYETEDGYPVGEYPYDEKAQCALGAGCTECGYRGKVRQSMWIPFDTAAWRRHEEADMIELEAMKKRCRDEGLDVVPREWFLAWQETWKKVREDRERASA